MSIASVAEPGGKLPLDELLGTLLLFEVHSEEKDIVTAYGNTDAMRVTVHAVDGTHAGEIYDDTLIFPRVLRSQLKPFVGNKTAGRLGKGVAKPGQSPPWKLEPLDDAAKAAANAYDAKLTAPVDLEGF